MNALINGVMWRRWLVAAVLGCQLVGCGTAPLGKQVDRLRQTPECCARYNEFEAQPMVLGSAIKLWFGEGAQVFRFDGETKSYFHALRLPATQGFYLSIQSHFNGKAYRYFKPRLITFDANWNMLEDLVPALEEVPSTVLVDHYMRAQVKLQQPAVYLVVASAKPPSPAVQVRRSSSGISNAHWTGSTALPGLNGMAYKISPEGKVVVTAKPYRLDVVPD